MAQMRKALPPLVALALVGATLIPWRSAPSDARVDAAAEGVAFERHSLPAAESNQRQRPVQPALEVIRPWISSVGSSVGAMDVRGQGFAGDACMTDPRDDSLKVFAVPGSKGKDFPTFELEPKTNYDKTMAPIGCVPADIDQDGRQDLIAYYWGRTPVVFRNVGDEGDTPSASMFRADELVEPAQTWNSTALNVTDIDGDGVLDIVVGNYFPDNARVLDPKATDDGNMAMQQSMGKARNAGTNQILLGKKPSGDEPMEFTDASARWPKESAKSWTLATGLQDLSGNGRPDMYVANDFGPDQFLVNESTPGDVQFSEVSGQRDLLTAKSKVMGKDSFKGMGITYSYEEGEDLPRMFVSNITTPWGLQESNFAFYPDGEGSELLNGNFPYKDRSTDSGMSQSGWSWDVKPLDANNSGVDSLIQANGYLQGKVDQWPRLQETAMGNDQILSHPGAWLKLDEDSDLSGHERNRFWIESERGKFSDIGDQVGFTNKEVSRGFAVADINDDGRQDFLVANQWQPSHAHVNKSRTKKDYVSLRVVRKARHGSASVVGAKVTVDAPGYQRRGQIFPANGHSGVSGDHLHFALSKEQINQATATVEWTDADGTHKQRFDLDPGRQELKVQP